MEQLHTSTKRSNAVLDDKYEKVDLDKVMKNKCQHLTETQRNELLKLLQKLKSCSIEYLVTGKVSSIIRIKNDVELISSKSYPVPKVHKEISKSKLNV